MRETMNTSKHSSPLLGLLVVFGCVFVGLIFFTSYETITASQDPIQSNVPSSLPYPPPQIVTQDPIYSESSSPYPPPGTQVPIPTSTVVRPSPTPTQIVPIPVDSSFDQAAIAYIAQNMGIDPGSLSLVESSTIVIPITQKRLWDGVLVDPNGKGKIIYQVLIDEGQRIILTGTGIDPQKYWDEAESLFRKAKHDSILSQVGQQNKIPVEKLSIVNGVFQSYPLTKTIVWHGKIETKDGNVFDYAVDLDGKPVDLRNVEAKEFETRSHKYGKLSEDLFYLLQVVPDDKLVEVALWMTGGDPGEISEKLKADFPEIGAEHFADGIPVDSEGKPVKVGKEKSEKIQEKYRYYLKEGTGEPKKPIMKYLVVGRKKLETESAMVDSGHGRTSGLPTER
jgi:hypothetical protein